MNEEEYQKFLKTAPVDHFSDEFVQFLRDNNKVIEETNNWLIIENCKDPNDYTAFFIGKEKHIGSWWEFIKNLDDLHKYYDREWKIKAPHKRTVKLFHIHLINKQHENNN